MFYFNRINSLFLVIYKKLFLKCPKEKAISKEGIEIVLRFFPFFFPRQIFSKISLILQSIAMMRGLHFPEENVSPKRFCSARFLTLTSSSLRNSS